MLNVGSVCGLRWLVINGTTFKDAGSGSVESDENEGSDPWTSVSWSSSSLSSKFGMS